MKGSIRSKIALATTAGALCLAGGAIASSPASAFSLHPTSTSSAAVAAGTKYSANATNPSFTNSNGSTTYAQCNSSTLAGVTTLNGATTGSTSNGINVESTNGTQSSSFSTCNVIGNPITVTGTYSPAWQLTPTAGSSPTFTGNITNVKVNLSCGATASGTISTGATENNSNSPASNVTLVNAGPLTLTNGTSCALPSSVTQVYVNAKYVLATVGSSAASSTNNLWLTNP